MTDITAYIGEPDMKEAFGAAARVNHAFIERGDTDEARRISDIVFAAVDAALAGMQTVTLSEVWGKEPSPGSIHKVEWIAEYIGDSQASHRRLVGPWEPIEDA